VIYTFRGDTLDVRIAKLNDCVCHEYFGRSSKETSDGVRTEIVGEELQSNLSGHQHLLTPQRRRRSLEVAH
jgi:hypothetical protein